MKLPLASLSRLAAPFVILCASAFPALAEQRVEGVPNFLAVNDQIYRGGQPSDRGFRNLAEMGVKTIVDLREEGEERSKDEKRLVKALGMKYVHIPMKGMKTPKDKQISQALRVLNDDSAAPVFIHCKRGADRTGAVLACYRIQHDKWDNRRALEEARGNGMYWYQYPLQRYILAFDGKSARGGGWLTDAATILESVKP